MGWNGSGGFDRLEDFTDDLAAGPPNDIVSAAKVDNEFDNFKAGLQNCLARDGQNSPTANISLGTYKITNLGTPTASADAATKAYVDGASYLGSGINGLTAGTVAALDLIPIADVSDSNNPKKVTAQSIANLASTSITLTMPTEFSVSGSPVSSTGTLAVSKANQNANLVYAGPSSGGAAAPAFRALAAADLPTATTSNQGALLLRSGMVVQEQFAEVTAYQSISATVPIDDTIPQSSETGAITGGSVTITPTNASNTLVLTAVITGQCGSGAYVVGGIWKDSDANATAVSVVQSGGAGNSFTMTIRRRIVAGSTSAQTYALRIGAQSGAAVYVNGNSGGRLYGGVSITSIEVQELVA